MLKLFFRRKIDLGKEILLLCLLLTAGAQSGIEYLPGENLLHVTDYPEERPCTPADLLRTDRIFGWNKVTCDEALQRYEIDCGLRIGHNDGSSTFFQIGSDAAPDETLVVRGTVHVYSVWLLGENRYTPSMPHHHIRNLKSTNRLTIGIKDIPSSRARLLIDSRKNQGKGYTIVVGGYTGYSSKNWGGDLLIHGGTIASMGDVPIGAGNPPQDIHMGGSDNVVFSNAVIRGCRTGFGRHLTDAHVKNTQFINCGLGYSATGQDVLRNCVFDGCKTALEAPSRNPLVVFDCVFRNNSVNWKLVYQPIIAVDCEVDDFDKVHWEPRNDVAVVSKRHLRVKVRDAEGKPVADALVRAETPDKAIADHWNVYQAFTSSDGMTPEKGEAGALLLNERQISVSAETPDRPQDTRFFYTLTAEKGEAKGVLEGIHCDRSGKCLVIAIQ